MTMLLFYYRLCCCVFFGLDEVGDGCLNVLYREASVWLRPKTRTDNSADGNGAMISSYQCLLKARILNGADHTLGNCSGTFLLFYSLLYAGPASTLFSTLAN